MRLPFYKCIPVALALQALGLPAASAAPINFSGNFTQDNDLQFFTFAVGATSDVNIFTTSFGTEASGNFVPWLSIWDAAGVGQGSTVNLDSADARFHVPNLAAGTYYGALYVWRNYAPIDFPGAVYDPAQFQHNGLLDTNAQYTIDESNCQGSTGYFVFDFGLGCANRGGGWALTVAGADSASLYPPTLQVPEPNSPALALAGGLAVLALRRRPALWASP